MVKDQKGPSFLRFGGKKSENNAGARHRTGLSLSCSHVPTSKLPGVSPGRQEPVEDVRAVPPASATNDSGSDRHSPSITHCRHSSAGSSITGVLGNKPGGSDADWLDGRLLGPGHLFERLRLPLPFPEGKGLTEDDSLKIPFAVCRTAPSITFFIPWSDPFLSRPANPGHLSPALSSLAITPASPGSTRQEDAGDTSFLLSQDSQPLLFDGGSGEREGPGEAESLRRGRAPRAPT